MLSFVQNCVKSQSASCTGSGEITGVIDDLRSAVVSGNTVFYLRLRGGEVYYTISAAVQPEAVILNTGDTVTVRFNEGQGSILTATSVVKTASQSPAVEE